MTLPERAPDLVTSAALIYQRSCEAVTTRGRALARVTGKSQSRRFDAATPVADLPSPTAALVPFGDKIQKIVLHSSVDPRAQEHPSRGVPWRYMPSSL